jgi:hypothetical protein
VHPFDEDWHKCMDNFVLDSKSSLVELLIAPQAMKKLNK